MKTLIEKALQIKSQHGVCPLLNNVITDIALLICKELNRFDKKAFDAAFKTAVEKCGYSYHYYNNKMRVVGPEYSDFE